MYAIKKVGSATARVVNVDRLAPFVQRNDEQFPPERREQEQADQEDRDEEVSKDDDDSSLPDVDEEMLDPVPSAITTRAQRARRRPAWQTAFELD